MRVMTLVEAVVALAIGVGGGYGFLYGTGDLKGAGEVAALQGKVDMLNRDIDEAKRAAQAAREAAIAREAAERAAAEAAAKAAAEKAAVEAAAKAQAQAQAQAAAAGPKFGLLSIRSLAVDMDIDAGPGMKKQGKLVDLAFEEQPGKIKIKAGKFTLMFTPKPNGKVLGLDVSVSPLAIIKADGVAMGTSASNLEVTKNAFKLDFSSPASGDLNLIMQFKK